VSFEFIIIYNSLKNYDKSLNWQYDKATFNIVRDGSFPYT